MMTNDRMTVDNESERMQKEAEMNEFTVLYWHLSGQTVGKGLKAKSEQLVCGQRPNSVTETGLPASQPQHSVH